MGERAPTAILACIPAIEEYLDRYTLGLNLPDNLKEAVRYSLLGGGKRLRPVLAWHAAVAVGASGQSSLPAGSAVELIHAFSLVHDDLPAMDDDDLRRGRPTLHIHAGEAMAILAGDAMMSLAFELLVARCPDHAVAATMVHELASATTGMIVGQVYDTLGGFPESMPQSQRLELTHRNKTGALIRAACRMGALCGLVERGKTDNHLLGAITRYGEAVGLMFQVVDDLLDVETTSEQTGKRTGKDAEAGKITYPLLLGIQGSRQEIERLKEAALAALDGLGPEADALRDLCIQMAVRRS